MPAVLIICCEVATGLAAFAARGRCINNGSHKGSADVIALLRCAALMPQVLEFVHWTVAANAARKLTTTARGTSILQSKSQCL